MRKSHPDCEVCQYRNADRKAKRDRWIAAGLCHRCGKVRSRYRTCRECRERDSAAKVARYQRRKVAA